MIRLKVRRVNLSSGGPLVSVLNVEDANKLDLHALDRIKLRRVISNKDIVSTVDISTKGIKKGEIGLFEETLSALGLKEGVSVEVKPSKKPKSIEYIKKKLDGKKLSKEELKEIVKDIMDNNLSEVELTYFIAGSYINKLDMKESIDLTKIMIDSSFKLKFKKDVILDKHCLSGDTQVMVKNSGKTKVEGIGNIIDEVFKRCSKNEISIIDGAEFTDKNLRKLQIPTYDNKGEVSYKPVVGVFRAKSPPYLYKVILKGNRQIKTTSDHTIFILKKGCIKNIPARDLKKGDFVVVQSQLKQDSEVKYIKIKTDYKIKNLRQFPNKISITPEFIRLLAYYISEGFMNYQGVFLNFGSHEKEMINDSIKCIKKVFGFKPTVNKPHKTATRVCMYSRTLSKIFKDLKIGSNAPDKALPYFIFDINKKLKLEFIKTLIKCDGWIRRSYEAEYGTSSKKLFSQLQYLFSTLNISFSTSIIKPTTRNFKTHLSSIKEHYRLYTQAREIFQGRQKANVAFINLLPIKELGYIDTKNIGLELRRGLKRQRFMTKQKLKKIQQFILSKDINKFLDGHLSVLEVKTIEKIPSDSEYVYDFKVDGYNKFMAGTAPICVHNCAGGVPNNRTSMIIVPIIAAAGYTIPKVSSRAITSATGTSDVMEVLAPVKISHEKIKKVVKKTNGCLVWQSSINPHGPDEKMIKIRHPLRLDPEGLLIASILAKKKAVGATHVIVDLPYGEGAKMTKKEARELKKKFIKFGKILGMKIKVILTDGSQPIGNGIGAALEAKDVLDILQGFGPQDLREKAVFMATTMLKMVGVRRAKKKVTEILNSGKAYEKMLEIIKEQGGKKNILLPKPNFTYSIRAKNSGIIRSIKNEQIVRIARRAGAPEDKAAGIYLFAHKNSYVKKGGILYTIHAENKDKSDYAVETALKDSGFVIEKR
jgi:putative thymidine phosphorylase